MLEKCVTAWRQVVEITALKRVHRYNVHAYYSDIVTYIYTWIRDGHDILGFKTPTL
jgi:hypothetical protein